MAELLEWSAQALRYQGSDGPVKVIYFRSRGEAETNDSFDQYDMEFGEQPVSFELKESSASASLAFFSGCLFDQVLEGEEHFENRKRALQDFVPKFKNNSRVVPIDLEPNHGPRFIERLREQDGRKKEDSPPKGNMRETKRKDKEPEYALGTQEKMKEDKKVDKKVDNIVDKKVDNIVDNKVDNVVGKKVDKEKKEEKKKRRKTNWVEEYDGVAYKGVRADLRALVLGITTEFNPSGMWIVEDFFNDEEVD